MGKFSMYINENAENYIFYIFHFIFKSNDIFFLYFYSIYCTWWFDCMFIQH